MAANRLLGYGIVALLVALIVLIILIKVF